MISFKQYLIEGLTPEQIKKYKPFKMTADARKKTNNFFGRGIDSVREEIKATEPTEKSETHKAVEQHIGQEIDIPHYVSGRTNPNQKGQQVRLGKVIKDPTLLQKFSIDPSRTGGRAGTTSGGYVTIHRGTQVAGQANPEPTECNPNGQSWAEESCKNINSGQYKNKLKDEVQKGTVVVFGHDNTGKEVYRATLQPHHNGQHTIYTVNSQYGIAHPSFVSHAQDVAKRLSSKGAPTDKIYKIQSGVYNNVPTNYAFHPDASEEFIADKYLNSQKQYHVAAAASHPKLPNSLVDKDINTIYNPKKNRTKSDKFDLQDAQERIGTLIESNAPGLRKEHISRILEENIKHGDDDYVSSLINHHNFDSDHIKQIMNAPKNKRWNYYREMVIAHPKASKEDVVGMINDPKSSFSMIKGALTSRHMNDKMLIDIAKHNNHQLTYTAVSKIKSPEAIDTIAKSPEYDFGAKLGVLLHPHSTSEHIAHILNHLKNSEKMSSEVGKDIILAALRHPKVTSDHIATIFGHPKLANIASNGDAIKPWHIPNLSKEHISTIIQHAIKPAIRADFLHHKSANKEHTKMALKDRNQYVRDEAQDVYDNGKNPYDYWTSPTKYHLRTISEPD